MVPLSHYLVLSAVLFGIGLFGALSRRHAISILMALELMFNAVNLSFIALSRYLPQSQMQGHVFAVFVIAVAAAEAAIGLAIVLGLYRNFKTVNVDEINLMKW